MPNKTHNGQPSAKQRRHAHEIFKAEKNRAAKIAKGNVSAIAQGDKIDTKRQTRRRLATMTPAQRSERRAAGMEHRAPRHK